MENNIVCFESIADAAAKAKKVFEFHPKTDARNEFYSFKPDVIMSKDPIYEALSEMMRGLDIDDDSLYEYTMDALVNIEQNDDEDADSLHDMAEEWADHDTDIFNSDMTAWLNRSDKNFYYTDEVLKEGIEDTFKLLQAAQCRQREEIYNEVIDVLANLVNEYPCDTD